MKINRRTLWAGIILAAGVIVAVACNRGADDPQGSVPKTSGDITGPSAADFTVKSTDIWISEEDRKWFKQHVPKFSVDGTVVTVSGHNPWDHPVQQGHAKQFWLKVFNKQDISQPFIGQAGPFTIDAKDSFSASVDLGYGYCFVEAELRLDSADNHANGGNPSYLFGAENLDVGGCKKPKNPKGPTCQIVPVPSPSPEVDVSGERTELPPCDLCDNIEGDQQEIPVDETTGLPYTRVFDEETGQFLCTKTSTGCVDEETGDPIPCCEETWVEQEPIVVYGEFGACTPNVNGSSGVHDPSCSRSRTVTVVVNEVNSCTQESREKSREQRTDSEPCQCPCTATTSYWKMNQGNDNARENACENRGGEWLDNVFVPGAFFNQGCIGSFCFNVCKFEPNPPGNPGNDLTLYDPPGIVSDCEDD